jgi:hypothetical protein
VSVVNREKQIILDGLKIDAYFNAPKDPADVPIK